MFVGNYIKVDVVGLFSSCVSFVFDEFAELVHAFYKLLFGFVVFLFVFADFLDVVEPLSAYLLNVHSKKTQKYIWSFSSKSFDITIPAILST